LPPLAIFEAPSARKSASSCGLAPPDTAGTLVSPLAMIFTGAFTVPALPIRLRLAEGPQPLDSP
jgi:hypothetical protein